MFLPKPFRRPLADGRRSALQRQWARNNGGSDALKRLRRLPARIPPEIASEIMPRFPCNEGSACTDSCLGRALLITSCCVGSFRSILATVRAPLSPLSLSAGASRRSLRPLRFTHLPLDLTALASLLSRASGGGGGGSPLSNDRPANEPVWSLQAAPHTRRPLPHAPACPPLAMPLRGGNGVRAATSGDAGGVGDAPLRRAWGPSRGSRPRPWTHTRPRRLWRHGVRNPKPLRRPTSDLLLPQRHTLSQAAGLGVRSFRIKAGSK